MTQNDDRDTIEARCTGQMATRDRRTPSPQTSSQTSAQTWWEAATYEGDRDPWHAASSIARSAERSVFPDSTRVALRAW